MRTQAVRPRYALFVVVGFLLVGAVVLALAAVLPAAADDTYHSQHIDLAAVGGAPLRSRFVENIHVNGPKIYAMEQYVLNGAAPLTKYQVTLWGYEAGSGCTPSELNGLQLPLAIPTAVLTTNVSGNGAAGALFTPEEAAGFKQLATTWDLRWTLTTIDGVESYASGCVSVTLD